MDATMLKEAEFCEYVLEKAKAYVAAVASKISTDNYGKEASEHHIAKINENRLHLEGINIFKNALYESMMDGFLTSAEYRKLKVEYTAAETCLNNAIAELERHLGDMQRSEKQRRIERINHFEHMTELDRRTVVSLIQSVRIINKSDIQIAFNPPYSILAFIHDGLEI